jgi:hypothetical protein
MAVHQNNPAVLPAERSAVAGAQTFPPVGGSYDRNVMARFLPPLLAVTNVIAIWWLLYLI